MFRFITAAVTGVVVALILLVAVELFSSVVHPFPKDFDGSQEQMCAHVARYPGWVLAVVVPMWSLSAGFSTWIAGRISERWAAVVIGVLWVAAVLFNISILPYPLWFKISSVLAITITVYFAYSHTQSALRTVKVATERLPD